MAENLKMKYVKPQIQGQQNSDKLFEKSIFRPIRMKLQELNKKIKNLKYEKEGWG